MDRAERERVLHAELVFDGETYDRDGLQAMVDGYQQRHQANLSDLAELRRTHDEISSEMTRELAETTSVWDHVKELIDEDPVGLLRRLLEKVPVVRELFAERPLADLLRDKVEVAERRTRQVGQFLATIEHRVNELQADVARLNKKLVLAAQNEDRAAAHVLELKRLEEAVHAELAAAEEGSTAARELQVKVDEVRAKIWRLGSQLRLFSNAEDRISAIVAMNTSFLQILTNLHGNMQALYEAGQEVLDELRGNLAGLATAAQASQLSADMQSAMGSLRTSVNRVAVLASNTSLYLTQNIEQLTSQMRIYDDATRALVESNLAAEREMMERRIDETIALAEREHGLMEEARAGGGAG